MANPNVSTTSARTARRRHVYDDILYVETPILELADGSNAATDLARTMVKLGVDGRGPLDEASSEHDMAVAAPRLSAHLKALAGFMVRAQLLPREDGRSEIAVVYTQAPGEAVLTVVDNPPDDPAGRLFNLRWLANSGGLYVPEESEFAASGNAAELYAGIVSGVMDPGSSSPLEVKSAKLQPFEGPSSHSFGTTIPRQGS